MIEKITSSILIQERPQGSDVPVPEGKGFAKELALANKTTEASAKDNDQQENKKSECCGNNDKDPASSSYLGNTI